MARCCDQLGLIKRHRGEPFMEQVPGPPQASLRSLRTPKVARALMKPVSMGLSDRPCQSVGCMRCQYQLNMIGHQTIGPYFYRCLVAARYEQVAIERVVRRFKESL